LPAEWLQRAAEGGLGGLQAAAVRLAVLLGARVNQADERGRTPLLIATANVLWAGAAAVEVRPRIQGALRLGRPDPLKEACELR
jgi:hypothetical protein